MGRCVDGVLGARRPESTTQHERAIPPESTTLYERADQRECVSQREKELRVLAIHAQKIPAVRLTSVHEAVGVTPTM